MKLRLYMKSGNQLLMEDVDKYNITTKGNLVTGIEIEYSGKDWDSRVLIQTVDLAQIEAVVRINGDEES